MTERGDSVTGGVPAQPKEWTAEQLHNAMTYGVCRTCRSPREPYLAQQRDEGGSVIAEMRGIRCPNGHYQGMS